MAERRLRRWMVLGAVLGCAPVLMAAPPAAPKPALQIALEKYGYRIPPDRYALAGAATETVNFVSEDRLLVTFAVRRLLTRIPEDESDHSDRIVQALLLKLPELTVIAQTEWRMHDTGMYLWPLEEGEFLLRERSRLKIFSPGRRGAEFEEHAAVQMEGQKLLSVVVSPEGNQVELESTEAPKVGDDPMARKASKVQFRMYRLRPGPERLVLTESAEGNEPVNVPFNDVGTLQASQEKSSMWGFDLMGFREGMKALGGVVSSCQPSATFVSRTEFLVSLCHGGDTQSTIGVLDLGGNVHWIAPGDAPVWAAVMSAPRAERVAVRSTLMNGNDPQPDVPAQIRSQTVRVLKMNTGEELLRVAASPAQRAPQNFALSPKGEQLAVWQGEMLNVFRLPEPTKKDREDAEAQARYVVKLEPVPEGR